MAFKFSVDLAKGAVTVDQKIFDAAQKAYYDGLLERTPPLTATMFEDAVDRLQTDGWTQGKSIDMETGQLCAEGAFCQFQRREVNLLSLPEVRGLRTHIHDQELATVFAVRREEIMKLMGIDADRFNGIIFWNDADGRTKDEVIDAFTKAAKTLREQGR